MPREDMIPMELIQLLRESLLLNALRVPIPRRTFQKTGKMLHFTYGKLPFSFAVTLLNTHVIYFRFLYTLFLAMDANFKLKSKDRGIKDIELSAGDSCFVETEPYEKHLEEYGAKAPDVGPFCRFPTLCH